MLTQSMFQDILETRLIKNYIFRSLVYHVYFFFVWYIKLDMWIAVLILIYSTWLFVQSKNNVHCIHFFT